MAFNRYDPDDDVFAIIAEQLGNETSHRVGEAIPEACEVLGLRWRHFVRWCGERRALLCRDFSPRAFYRLYLYKTKHIRREVFGQSEWKRLRRYILQRDNFTCHYCGARGGILEVDHKTPVSRGGTDGEENLVTACRSCNRRKRAKPYDVFVRGLHA